MNEKHGFLYKAYHLYADGFREMTLGRTLWAVIIIKLIIMFGILKVFFFPNFLSTHAQEGNEQEYVGQQLVDRGAGEVPVIEQNNTNN